MSVLAKYSDQPEDINLLSKEVVDCLFQVHKELGPGYLEHVYEECFCIEAKSRGLNVICQFPVNMTYRGQPLAAQFRLDVVVDHKILLELKAVERILPVHEAQIYSYLRMTGLPMGFLVNFNVPLIKDGLKRYVPRELRSSGPSR